VGDVIEIGRRLTEAKAMCRHGEWLPWLDKEFGWSDDTALNFTRVYEMDKSRTVRDLGLSMRGLYLLARPSAPEPVRAEVIQRAEAGEYFTHAQVKPTMEYEQLREAPPIQPAQEPQTHAVVPYFFGNQEIRTIDVGAKLAWVLTDVCKGVGIGNAPMVASRLDADEKDAICITDSIGRQQIVTVVYEPGLYKVLRYSRKPEAKAAADRFDRCASIPSGFGLLINPLGAGDPVTTSSPPTSSLWSNSLQCGCGCALLNLRARPS
jgi:hypothetical protein